MTLHFLNYVVNDVKSTQKLTVMSYSYDIYFAHFSFSSFFFRGGVLMLNVPVNKFQSCWSFSWVEQVISRR